MITKIASIATATVIGAAAVALSAGSAFAATPEHHVGHTMLSQTFWVYNVTGQPLTITGETIDGHWDGVNPPTDGTVVAPGTAFRFDMEKDFGYRNIATVDFSIGNTGADLHVTAYSTTGPNGEFGLYGSSVDTNDFTVALSGLELSTLSLESAKPTVHTIGDDEGQAQYQAFNNLCADGNNASCKFHITTAPVHQYVNPAPMVGSLVDAHGMNVTQQVSWSHTTEISNQYSVEAGLTEGVEGIVTAEVKLKYEHSATESDTVSDSVEITVHKGNVGWLTYAAPVERVTGDFTITLGNDTWNLTDVHFDVPLDTDGNGSAGKIVANELPEGDPGIPNVPAFRHHN